MRSRVFIIWIICLIATSPFAYVIWFARAAYNDMTFEKPSLESDSDIFNILAPNVHFKKSHGHEALCKKKEADLLTLPFDIEGEYFQPSVNAEPYPPCADWTKEIMPRYVLSLLCLLFWKKKH